MAAALYQSNKGTNHKGNAGKHISCIYVLLFTYESDRNSIRLMSFSFYLWKQGCFWVANVVFDVLLIRWAMRSRAMCEFQLVTDENEKIA